MERKPFSKIRFLENRFWMLFSVYSGSFLLCFFLAWMEKGGEANADAYIAALPLLAFYLPLLFFVQSEGGQEASLGMERIEKAFLPQGLLFLVSAFTLGTGGSLLCGSLGLPLLVYGLALPTSFSPLSFFAVVFLGAFCEEMLLRGALQARLASFGAKIAVPISTCLSAALCFSLTSLPLFLAVGGLCAFVRHRAHSVWAALWVAASARLGIYLVAVGAWQSLGDKAGVGLLSALLLAAALVSFVALFFARGGKPITYEATEGDGKNGVIACLLALLFLGLSVGASFLIPTV